MRILFYNDSPVFGGHEIATVNAVIHLIRHTDLDIGFIFFEGNEKLYQRLNMMFQESKSRVYLYPISYKSGSFQGIKTLFSLIQIKKVQDLLGKYKPEIVVVSQGGIELSSLGLIAAKRSNYKVISYIPLAFKMTALGVKLGLIRDRMNRYFYKLPDKFITISYSMAHEISNRGVLKNKINVVYCGIDTKLNFIQNKSHTKYNFGIAEDDYVMAIIGRIQFKQKGHDFLINAISKNINKLGKFKLLIVGDGPDEEALKFLVNQKKLNDYVIFNFWNNDIYSVYSVIDLLVIPSRFEGLPLVMLEAMYYNIPIVASNLDGIKEVLPDNWLFKQYNSDSFIKTLLNVKNSNNIELTEINKQKIISQFTLENFGNSFYEAVINL